MSLLFCWCTTCLHFLVPYIICPNSEAGPEPEKSSSPALDYFDSSAAPDDSGSSVIKFNAKSESSNTRKRQRIRVPHTHDRTAQYSEKISNSAMNFPRAPSHNFPPSFLVGSSHFSLQKGDVRYDINWLSDYKIRPIWLRQKDWFFWANWAFDTGSPICLNGFSKVDACFVALLDLKGLLGEISLFCTTITTTNRHCFNTSR